MNRADYQALPLAVRDGFDGITNDEIDDDTQLQAWLAQRADVHAQHTAAVVRLQILRDAKARVQADQEALQGRIAAAEHDRRELARRIVLGEAEDSSDVAHHAQIADLRRQGEMFTLAVQALEADIKTANLPIARAAADGQDIDIKIDERREALKLKRAKAMAGFGS